MTELARIDVLPPACSVSMEIAGEHVRFTAVDADGRTSVPSGWFPVSAAPIFLSWAAFDFDGNG